MPGPECPIDGLVDQQDLIDIGSRVTGQCRLQITAVDGYQARNERAGLGGTEQGVPVLVTTGYRWRAGRRDTRPADDAGDAGPTFVGRALAAAKRCIVHVGFAAASVGRQAAVVAGEHDDRVILDAVMFEPIQQGTEWLSTDSIIVA